MRWLPRTAEPRKTLQALAAAATRDATSADRPVVVVLPGVMGSHLKRRRQGPRLVRSRRHRHRRAGEDRLGQGRGGSGRTVLRCATAGLCEELGAQPPRRALFRTTGANRSTCWPNGLGELPRQADEGDAAADPAVGAQHGRVGGARLHSQASPGDGHADGARGARFVMLGTPHQGAHSMVENLLGKGDTLRTLVRLDLKHDMQEVLDIVAGFRGALQLLPKPGFTDTFQGQTDGGGVYEYQSADTWDRLQGGGTRFLVRRQACGTPRQDVARRRRAGCGAQTARRSRRCRPSLREEERSTSSASHPTRPAACARN